MQNNFGTLDKLFNFMPVPSQQITMFLAILSTGWSRSVFASVFFGFIHDSSNSHKCGHLNRMAGRINASLSPVPGDFKERIH
jgi:hypothetical protein